MSLIHLLLVAGVFFSAPRETVDRLYLGKLIGISHYSIYLPTEDGGFAVVRCGEFTLAKYSRDGRQEWFRELTKGSPSTWCYHISQTRDNGYILAGYQYSLAVDKIEDCTAI